MKKLEEAKKQLEEERLNKVNVTDTDARLMQDSKKVIQPGYNGQIGVDAKEQVIVSADVTQDATDHYQLEPMVEQAEQNLGESLEQISADAGYSSYDNLEYVEEKEIDGYIPDNKLREKLRSEEGKKIYQMRSYTVEPVFGNIKWNKRRLIMSMRGKRKVKGDFLLMCLAHNIGKIISKIQTVAEQERVCYQPMMVVAG